MGRTNRDVHFSAGFLLLILILLIYFLALAGGNWQQQHCNNNINNNMSGVIKITHFLYFFIRAQKNASRPQFDCSFDTSKDPLKFLGFWIAKNASKILDPEFLKRNMQIRDHFL